MTEETAKINPYDEAVAKAGKALEEGNLASLLQHVLSVQSTGFQTKVPRGELFLLLEGLTTAGAATATETNNPLFGNFHEMAEGFHAATENEFPQKPTSELSPMTQPK